jgi:hypothetical protein
LAQADQQRIDDFAMRGVLGFENTRPAIFIANRWGWSLTERIDVDAETSANARLRKL